MSEKMHNWYKLYKHSWNHCSTFSGRASIAEYWVFNIIYFVIFLIFIATAVWGIMFAEDSPLINNICRLFAIPMSAHFMVGILPLISVTVRRLHDANFSGILALLMLVPGGWLVLIVLCSQKAKTEANQWGTPVIYPWQKTPYSN